MTLMIPKRNAGEINYQLKFSSRLFAFNKKWIYDTAFELVTGLNLKKIYLHSDITLYSDETFIKLNTNICQL